MGTCSSSSTADAGVVDSHTIPYVDVTRQTRRSISTTTTTYVRGGRVQREWNDSPIAPSASSPLEHDDRFNTLWQSDRVRSASDGDFYNQRVSLLSDGVLSKSQFNALEHVTREATHKSAAIRKSLIQRFEQLGYSTVQLDAVLRYVRDDAPLLINLNLAVPSNNSIPNLLTGTHYLNGFELEEIRHLNSNPSYQDQRRGVESRFSGEHYHVERATAQERPKYGCLNWSKDSLGVNAASGYGQSYLVMRSHVRARVTVADTDTFCYHTITTRQSHHTACSETLRHFELLTILCL